jgi:mRNA interferase RelE/StbE
VYALLVTCSAERDLRRLPRAAFEWVNAKILALRDNPRPHGVRKLVGALEGWRIRVGDYCVLYQIDDEGPDDDRCARQAPARGVSLTSFDLLVVSFRCVIRPFLVSSQ